MIDKKLIPRPSYEEWLKVFLGKPLIKVLTGIRRSGKSSILRRVSMSLLAEGVQEGLVFYVNMELLENERFRDFRILHREVKERAKKFGGRIFLFLDEVQEISEWERLANSLLAEGVADITVTGSNALMLSGELASLLGGRYVELPIFPLVFSEYAAFRQEAPVQELFLQFIQCGGFPGSLELGPGREQYLEALLDSIVLRDVVLRHKLRDVALLRKILVYFSDNIGNLLSARTIAGVLKNERRSLSVETIYNYLEYLKQAFVVYEAKPYDIRGKRLLETGGKVYLADLGLRHALLGFRASDIGQYLENILYLELCKRGWKVSVGRVGEWEVDFRAEKGDLRSYFQVAYLTPDAETLERELRPLRAIRDNCPKFLLTIDPLPASNEEGIQRMPLVEFLTQAVD